MKLFSPFRFFFLLAGLSLALPATSPARDSDHSNHHDWHSGDHRDDGGRYYRGHYYRYGYGRPYYGYGYGYPYYYGPSFGFTWSGGRGREEYDNSDNLAVDVQRALKRRGYYGGSIDGDVGPGTRNALRRYQDEHRLDVTGRIDRDTLRALDL